MSEVATVAGGSAVVAARGVPPAGRTFMPLAQGRDKAKAGGIGRAKRTGIKRKNRPGESLRSFTQRFVDLYLQLPKVSERLVVDAFDAGTTNRQVVEDLMLSPGPNTIARLFQIAYKHANRELCEDTPLEPSRQGRSLRHFRSKSPQWHLNRRHSSFFHSLRSPASHSNVREQALVSFTSGRVAALLCPASPPPARQASTPRPRLRLSVDQKLPSSPPSRARATARFIETSSSGTPSPQHAPPQPHPQQPPTVAVRSRSSCSTPLLSDVSVADNIDPARRPGAAPRLCVSAGSRSSRPSPSSPQGRRSHLLPCWPSPRRGFSCWICVTILLLAGRPDLHLWLAQEVSPPPWNNGSSVASWYDPCAYRSGLMIKSRGTQIK
nr:uncharacterized protein LOC127329463 [Lolium perenne]